MDFLLERDPERPFLLYLHMLDAHWPYPVPDEYATRYASAEAVERFRGKDWKALRDEVNHGERPFVGAERDAEDRGLWYGERRLTAARGREGDEEVLALDDAQLRVGRRRGGELDRDGGERERGAAAALRRARRAALAEA